MYRTVEKRALAATRTEDDELLPNVVEVGKLTFFIHPERPSSSYVIKDNGTFRLTPEKRLVEFARLDDAREAAGFPRLQPPVKETKPKKAYAQFTGTSRTK